MPMNRYFLIVAFACLLLAPLVNDIFSVVHFERADENRTFQDSLVLDIKRLDAFPKDCEAYINDNFSFRTPSIKLYQKIKTYIFDVAPTDKETVLIGMNQRYFMAGEEKKLYEGEATFTEAQLDTIRNEWNKRIAYYRNSHIQTFWLVAPSALEIHSLDLPTNVQKLNTLNATQQFVKLLNQNNPGLVTYPIQELRSRAISNNLYFKMDNHWNETGAYYAVRSLFKRIKKQIPHFNTSFMLDTIQRMKTKKGGYLADQLHQSSRLEYYKSLQLKAPQALQAEKFNFPITSGFPYPDDFEHHFKNPKAKNKQRVLVIRDSFGTDCIPFIAEAFSESLFIFDGWQYGMNTEILETFKPDLVIYITYEPHLVNFIR
jgi:hypothetical protein